MSKAPRSNFGMALRAESQRPATSLQSRSRRTESAQNPAAGGISTRASQKGAPRTACPGTPRIPRGLARRPPRSERRLRPARCARAPLGPASAGDRRRSQRFRASHQRLRDAAAAAFPPRTTLQPGRSGAGLARRPHPAAPIGGGLPGGGVSALGSEPAQLCGSPGSRRWRRSPGGWGASACARGALPGGDGGRGEAAARRALPRR